MGYGPARYFSSAQVKEISSELNTITKTSLFENYEAMLKLGDEIYPGFQDTSEDREYIQQYFKDLKIFCNNASNDNKCLITYMA